MIVDVQAGGVYRAGPVLMVALSPAVQLPPTVPGGTVLAAPILRTAPLLYGVELAESDPVSGWVHLAAANQAPLDALEQGRAALLTGSTLDRIVTAFRAMSHGE